MYRNIIETPGFESDCAASGLSRDEIDRRLEGWCWLLAKNPKPDGALPPTKGGKTWLVRTRARGPRRDSQVPVLWLYYTFDDTTVTFEALDVMFEPNETLRL